MMIWSLTEKLKHIQSRADYLVTAVMVLTLFYFLVKFIKESGIGDVINSEEIMRQNQAITPDDQQRIIDLYKGAKGEIPASNNGTQPNSVIEPIIPVSIDENPMLAGARRFIANYLLVKEDYEYAIQLNLEAIEKADKCYATSYTGGYLCYISTLGSYLYLSRKFCSKMLYQFRASDTVVYLTTNTLATDFKVWMLQSWAFGKYVFNNGQTTLALIGAAHTAHSIHRSFGDWAGQVKRLTVARDADITPFKFNINDIKRKTDEMLESGGGERFQTMLQGIQRMIEGLDKINEIMARQIQLKLRELQSKLALKTAFTDEERLHIEREALALQAEALRLQEMALNSQLRQEQRMSDVDEAYSGDLTLQLPLPLLIDSGVEESKGDVEEEDFETTLRLYEQRVIALSMSLDTGNLLHMASVAAATMEQEQEEEEVY
jgi:hypothetical protein